jgi:hypothetical protein
LVAVDVKFASPMIAIGSWSVCETIPAIFLVGGCEPFVVSDKEFSFIFIGLSLIPVIGRSNTVMITIVTTILGTRSINTVLCLFFIAISLMKE